MTSLTIITVLVVLYGALSAKGYGQSLALGGATAAGAAVVVAGTPVPTFYATAIGVVVALGLQLFHSNWKPLPPRRRFPPAVGLLVVFFVWSTFVTLVSPVIFNGLIVPVVTGGTRRLIPATFTTSNLAQVAYLFLGLCVVLFIARSPTSRPQLIGLAAGTTTVLSLWRYFHQEAGVPFPEGLFDNSPTLAFIETAPGNVSRFRGILSEPAGLAGSSLVTVAYMLPRSFQLSGWRRAGAIFVAAAAGYMGAISTSGTFVVAGVAFVAIAGLTFALGFLMRRSSLRVLVSVASCALVIAALWVLPIVAAFVESTINEKVASPSFNQRSGADSGSYDILFDTFGFGVGLGSNRASSFFPGILSTTGVIGATLLGVAIALLIQRAAAVREYRPVIWALVALLTVKVVAGPDLSDSSGVFWLSLGLLSHAAMERGLIGRSGLNPPDRAGVTQPQS